MSDQPDRADLQKAIGELQMIAETFYDPEHAEAFRDLLDTRPQEEKTRILAELGAIPLMQGLLDAGYFDLYDRSENMLGRLRQSQHGLSQIVLGLSRFMEERDDG